MNKRFVIGALGLLLLLASMPVGSLARGAAATPVPGVASVDSVGAPRFQPSGREASTNSSPIGGRFAISTVSSSPTHAAEINPAAAYSVGMRRYLVVWDALTPDGGASVVYGRFVDLNGVSFATPFQISPLTGYNQYADVAYDAVHNQFLVVYEGGSGAGRGIRGVIVDSFGVPGPDFSIADTTGGDPSAPAVAYCPASGKYLVTWRRVGTAVSGIEARAVNYDGTPDPGAPLEITGMVSVIEPSNPDVAYDKVLDQFLIVWQQWSSVSETIQHDIRGQQVSTVGGAHLVGPNVPIFDSTDDEVNPAVDVVTTIGSNMYLVVAQRWYGGSASFIDGWTVDAVSSGHVSMLPISALQGYAPAIAGNESVNQYLVVWVQDNYTLTGRTISWNEERGPLHSLSSSSPLARPAIAAGWLQDDYLVAYEDRWESGYPADIFGWRWGIWVYLPVVLRNYP